MSQQLRFLIPAALAILMCAAPATAQRAKPAPEPTDLRTVYATVPDILEGKRVDEVSCARCHGANSISAAAGIPHIAGQRPPYLYAQLRAYLRGTRPRSFFSVFHSGWRRIPHLIYGRSLSCSRRASSGGLSTGSTFACTQHPGACSSLNGPRHGDEPLK